MTQVPVRRESGIPDGFSLWVDPWRWNPIRDLEAIIDRMWRMPPAYRLADGFTPAVDVEETDDAYTFEVELPGVRKEDVSIEVGERELHITGKMMEKKRTGVLRQQMRHTGTFDYRTTLPPGIDPDRAEAHFDSGVLTVRIPKTEAGQRRKVEIS